MKKIFIMIFWSVCFLTMIVVTSNGQSNDSSNSNGDQKNSPQQKTTKGIVIISKPRPSSKGCSQNSGVAILKVTFDKSAKITEATIYKVSGCDIFDKNAIEAAKKIKFEPGLKDGEAITATKYIEYKF